MNPIGTTMGFMFRGRIVAKKEISSRNAANTFDLIALPRHYSQWLESCKHANTANTSCLETLSKYVIDSKYDIECLETCSVSISLAYKTCIIWYHIIIMSWWSTILHTRLPILIPVTSFWCTKGTQDPLSFPTSPARPGKNPKSSRSNNCFWGSCWGTFHLPKVRQAIGLSSKGKKKFSWFCVCFTSFKTKSNDKLLKFNRNIASMRDLSPQFKLPWTPLIALLLEFPRFHIKIVPNSAITALLAQHGNNKVLRPIGASQHLRIQPIERNLLYDVVCYAGVYQIDWCRYTRDPLSKRDWKGIWAILQLNDECYTLLHSELIHHQVP